jgi:hypothetical protein
MAKMTSERAQAIRARLAVFAKLERRATDEIGWIQLAYGVSRAKAARMIDTAKAMFPPDAPEPGEETP